MTRHRTSKPLLGSVGWDSATPQSEFGQRRAALGFVQLGLDLLLGGAGSRQVVAEFVHRLPLGLRWLMAGGRSEDG
jgi:hypothetical protein